MAKYENIVSIAKMLSEGTVSELSKKVAAAERTAGDILKRLAELDNARLAKRAEEERIAREAAAAEEAAVKKTEERVIEEVQPEPEVVEEKVVITEEPVKEEVKTGKAVEEKPVA